MGTATNVGMTPTIPRPLLSSVPERGHLAPQGETQYNSPTTGPAEKWSNRFNPPILFSTLLWLLWRLVPIVR